MCCARKYFVLLAITYDMIHYAIDNLHRRTMYMLYTVNFNSFYLLKCIRKRLSKLSNVSKFQSSLYESALKREFGHLVTRTIIAAISLRIALFDYKNVRDFYAFSVFHGLRYW